MQTDVFNFIYEELALGTKNEAKEPFMCISRNEDEVAIYPLVSGG